MKQLALVFLCFSAVSVPLTAQFCDPTVAPSGLSSTYTPGSGALLQWDAVPGSVGVQLRIELPSGSTLSRRIVGVEPDQFAVPESLLTPGTYSFRVQAACTTVVPYSVTPISTNNSFTVGGGTFCPATVADIDGNVYNTVEIGGQCWMQENLKVERYRNGTAIPTGLSNSAWSNTMMGAFSVYDNEEANKNTYGLLYNWYAAVDARGLCPEGWHVPADAELTELISFLGSGAGGKMKTTGTLNAGTGLWRAPNVSASNSSGFSALPGGDRYGDGGTYNFQGFYGYLWSSTEISPGSAYNRTLSYYDNLATRYTNFKQDGHSVRCLKD